MDLARRLRTHTQTHTDKNIIENVCAESYLEEDAGVQGSSGVLPELRLLISSHVGASKFLQQDSDDADEQDEIDLVEK